MDGAGLEYIHRSKTAALIRASVVAGALAGGAEQPDITRLIGFGENIGWAFQVVDDLLDVEESSAALGKTAGKDQAQQKATYPALYGLDKSRAIAAELEAKPSRNSTCTANAPRGCVRSGNSWWRAGRDFSDEDVATPTQKHIASTKNEARKSAARPATRGAWPRAFARARAGAGARRASAGRRSEDR